MTQEQLFIILQVVRWCDKNVEKNKRERTIEELSSACVGSIPNCEFFVHLNVVYRYINTYLS